MSATTKEEILRLERERKAERLKIAEERRNKRKESKNYSSGATGFAPERQKIQDFKDEVERLTSEIEKLNQLETIHLLDTSKVFLTQYANRNERYFHTTQFKEISEDIKKNGQASPVLVRPKKDTEDEYELIFGNTRLQSCINNNMPVKAIVVEANDRKLAILQEAENSKRKDLSVFDQGSYYALLIQNGLFNSQAELAEEFDKSISKISKLFKLAKLPEWIKQNLCNDGFTLRTERAIEELADAWFNKEISDEKKNKLEDDIDKYMEIDDVLSRIRKATSFLIQKNKKQISKPSSVLKHEFPNKGLLVVERTQRGVVKVTMNQKMSIETSKLESLNTHILKWIEENA